MSISKRNFLAILLSLILAASLIFSSNVGAEASSSYSGVSSSGVLAVTKNVSTPQVPVILSATLNANLLLVTGTAQSGAVVNIFDSSNHLLGTTVADANGNFSLSTSNTSGIIPGTTTVAATATVCLLAVCANSQLGLPVLVSSTSATPTTTATPTATPPVLAVTLITSAVLNAGVLTVTGTAQPNALVNVYDGNGSLLGTTLADANGNFTLGTTNTSGISVGSTVKAAATVCIANICTTGNLSLPVTVVASATPTATTPVPTSTSTTPVPTSTATATTTTPVPTSTATATTTTPVPTSTATPTVTPTLPGGTSNTVYNYYLPFLANNYNNFTTYMAVQGDSADFSMKIFDNGGNQINTSALNHTNTNGEIVMDNPFTNGNKGNAWITSNKPLHIVVAESTPYGGSAYTVGEGSSQSLIVPIALHNAYGGFTTQLNVFNTGTSVNNVQAIFFTNDGAIASTQNFTLNPNSSQTVDQANLPEGFIGWATLTGTGSLVAQVLEQNPNSHFVAIMNAQSGAKNKMYAPAIFNNAFGGFFTGANLINPNSTAVNATITYHDHAGSSLSGGTITIAAHSAVGIFQANKTGQGLPANGLPDQFYGALEVSSDAGGIVLVVNEAGGSTQNGNARSGTYAAADSGVNSMVLPVTANGAYGYVTGATILNTSGSAISGTMQYYWMDGSVAGAAKPFTINPYSSLPIYQGADGLSNNFYGSALVVQTGGPANSLISTTNAQSSSFFYTYTEPTP